MGSANFFFLFSSNLSRRDLLALSTMQNSYPVDTRYGEAPAMHEIPMEQQNPFQDGNATHNQYAYGQYQAPNQPQYAPPVPYDTRPGGFSGNNPVQPVVTEREKKRISDKVKKRLYV